MINEMSQVNETARSHMQRDTESGGKWTCSCLECSEVRSLVGMEKVMEVWLCVRELNAAEEKLNGIPDGPEKESLWTHYLSLIDQLAARVAR
jgi:hypothetical protein